jgi:heme/copper-type cytochrome/quinol oxidase subunit 1
MQEIIEVFHVMVVGIPTGIKMFNWLATMWGGSIRFTTAMLFAVGSVAVFTLGGLSGIMHASPPVDLQQHDSYFVVAHFHYVIAGAMLMAFFGGLYFWFPKVTGKLLSETVGKWHFWLTFIGFNLTFFPQHFSGLYGMPRRTWTYLPELNVQIWNQLSTVGAYIFGLSALVLAWNLFRSARRGESAGPNPWNSFSLEWAIPSPPHHYNFPRLPEVESRESLWREGERQRVEAVTMQDPDTEPVMPSPSYWPILTAAAITLTWVLVMTGAWWAPLIGVALTAVCVFSWAFEPEFG